MAVSTIPWSLHHLNAWLCFIGGYATNGALLWLIAFHTQEEGRKFKPILLLSTLTSLVYLAAIVVVVPMMAMKRGCNFVLSLGPLGWLPQPYSFALAFTWNYLIMFSMVSICVPFLYRYMVICKGRREWGLRQFLTMLLAGPALVSAGHVFNCYWVGYVGAGEKAQREAREFLSNNTHASIGISDIIANNHLTIPYLTTDEASTLAIVGYVSSWMFVNYTLVFVCGLRIRAHLKKETTDNLTAERAHKISQQVNRALLLQALVPLVVELVPTAWLVAVGMGANLPAGEDISVFGVAMWCWAPVLNPLVTMWVVRAYRRVVLLSWLEVCKCGRGTAVSQTTGVAGMVAIEMAQQTNNRTVGSQLKRESQQLHHG